MASADEPLRVNNPYLSCMAITGVIDSLSMAIAHSKLTAQGRTSVPTEVRRRLGIVPGSALEWDDDGEQIVVRRVGLYSSEDIHQAVFSKPLRARTLEEMKEGIRRSIRSRCARR